MATKITPTRLFDFPYYQLEEFNLPKAFATKHNNTWVSISSKEPLSIFFFSIFYTLYFH